MAIKTVFLTTVGTGTYTIPGDFISCVSVEAIGGGGSGFSSAVSATGGGGGGAYAKSTSVTGLTANGVAYYQVGTTATDSWFNAQSNGAPTLTSQGVLAKGGTTATSGTFSQNGGDSTLCIGDLKFGGGSGGSATVAKSAGGGGGAGGPVIAGGTAGNGYTTSATSGGGGGGSGYGNITSNANSGQLSSGGSGGAAVGIQTAGSGGTSTLAANNTAPAVGGGGGGGFNAAVAYNGGAGATSIFWSQTSNGATAGFGGGGGGAGGAGSGAGGNGALYGGGGGGGVTAGVGAQGIIVFTYLAFDPKTGFNTTDPNTNTTKDLGQRYITKNYLLDVYPNLASATGNRTAPGLWGWGDNSGYGLGLGYTASYSSPVQVGSLTNWKQVSLGAWSSVAIKTDGTMWSWGWNNTNTGALGQNIGTSVYYSSPVQIGALTTWKQVSCGIYKTHAIKTDGTLWAWGDNFRGALGLGNTATYYSSPIQVGALTNWKQLGQNSCNGNADFSMAIKSDGTLWSWGDNRYGQLGINAVGTLYYSNPIQVGTLTTWKQVAGGGTISVHGMFASAIKTDGTLWSWGSNKLGQLGNGQYSATTYYSSPIQVGALTNWKQVSLGSYHGFAIKTDGTLWTWGWNFTGGVLGLGSSSTTLYYSSPVQIGALTNWKYINSGAICVTAIKTDGTLWAWGAGGSGNLGNGTTSYSSPVQIGTLTTWKSVATNGYTTLAIQDGYY